MKARITTIAAAVAAALALATAPVRAGGAAGMATEVTQLANNAELVAIYAENVAQVQQMIQQYQNMLQNTLNLPQQMWPSIFVQIEDLVEAVGAVEGAANASVNALSSFASHYTNSGVGEYIADIKRWRQGVRNQIGEALRQAGLNINNMRSTHQALQQIQAASQSAQGRMQVLQAANQISGLMVNEITSLHQTIVAAEQARLNYMQTEIEEKKRQEDAVQEFFRSGNRRYF